jgi:hypothetical protein
MSFVLIPFLSPLVIFANDIVESPFIPSSPSNQTTLTCSPPVSATNTPITTKYNETPDTWSIPVGVWNQGPNPVHIKLCADSACSAGSNKLTCVPELPPLFNGTLITSSGLPNQLNFGAIRIVYCSNSNGKCFDGTDSRYYNLVTTTTSNSQNNNAYAESNSGWKTVHVIIPSVKDNSALCWSDQDCQANFSQPICNRDDVTEQPRCVTVQHFLGDCGSPCLLESSGFRCWCHQLNELLSYTYGAVGLTLLTYFLIYLRIARARALALEKNEWGMKNAILPLYRTYYQFFGIYLFFTVALRIVLSFDDTTNKNGGGNSLSNNPIHYVHWYEEGQPINVGLRSLVAFLEETMLESVVFFFLQYGSGIDQGYRAVAGGVICGMIFGALTAFQHIPIGNAIIFPDLTNTGTCLGCLLDREGFGYHRPYSSYCWIQLFRSGVYQCSSIVLYLFVLCQRRYENMILDHGGSLFRCCCDCLLREPSIEEKKKLEDRRTKRRSNSVSFTGSDSSGRSIIKPLLQQNGGIGSNSVQSIRSFHSERSTATSTSSKKQVLLLQRNVHFDRFLMLLIVLRLLDMSYMLSKVGSCMAILGSFMWLVWLQTELYMLFLSDTQYWKNYMNDLVKRSQNEMAERRYNHSNGGNGSGSNTNHHNNGGGGGLGSLNALSGGVVFSGGIYNSTVIDESIYKGSSAGRSTEQLLLSPAASHWVKPRNTPLEYQHPPRNRLNQHIGSSTDDSLFYSRGAAGKKRSRPGMKRSLQRRALGSGKTITEDFNEEAAVSIMRICFMSLYGQY